tara:strand:- start:1719 stop:2519 length:801 start_codon:yes stop_codon:yes gene_type:complete
MTRKLLELINLRGKKVLVIGGGGWLGRAAVEVAVECGAEVSVAGHSPIHEFSEKKGWLLDLINKEHVKYYEVDVRKEESISFLRAELGTKAGLDALVNCFWEGRKSGWDDSTLENWLVDIDVNLNGTYRVCKAFSDDVVKTSGSILNISSMYSSVAPRATMYKGVPQSNPPGYGAAKAGINQLSRYLASFLGQHGVNVNSISPGAFPFPEIVEEHPIFSERLNEQTMLRRIGAPEDIKGIISILISDAGSYITGQNIAVDGGWTAW